MKRFNHLWEQVISFENLYQAARLAQKGKRFNTSTLVFNDQLENELNQLQEELTIKTYQPGEYRTFRIYDPKPRLISAAPYRDRVVHHALCNVIVPLIERSFIETSYANRVGYGNHRALRKFTQYARSSHYILQCDIQKYFPSIHHSTLKGIIRRKIRCRSTLWLIETIIDNSNPQEAVDHRFSGVEFSTESKQKFGLPIGNLTSQFFANLYLNEFDHFVKEKLLCKQYLRFVDDFALFSDDLDYLHHCRQAIEEKLAQIHLKIHPVKSQIFETAVGANFVGFRVLPDRIRVRNDNIRKNRKRIREMQEGYGLKTYTLADIIQRLASWEAHLKHGNTYRLRQKIFSENLFKRYEQYFIEPIQRK